MTNEEKKVCSNAVFISEFSSANCVPNEYVPSGVAMARYAASLTPEEVESDRRLRKTLIAQAVKDTYEIRTTFLPKKVKSKEWLGDTGGRWEDKWIGFGEKYIVYKGEALHPEYKLHLCLSAGSWYPGIENNPFLILD